MTTGAPEIEFDDPRRRRMLDHASGVWSAANRYAVVLVLLIGLFVFFSLTQDRFLTSPNVENLLTSVSILWVVSMGMTFVVLTAGIDLSVGVATRPLRDHPLVALQRPGPAGVACGDPDRA